MVAGNLLYRESKRYIYLGPVTTAVRRPRWVIATSTYRNGRLVHTTAVRTLAYWFLQLVIPGTEYQITQWIESSEHHGCPEPPGSLSESQTKASEAHFLKDDDSPSLRLRPTADPKLSPLMDIKLGVLGRVRACFMSELEGASSYMMPALQLQLSLNKSHAAGKAAPKLDASATGRELIASRLDSSNTHQSPAEESDSERKSEPYMPASA